MRALWLSRHPLSAEQQADLCNELEVESVEVLQINETFSDVPEEAIWDIFKHSEGVYADVILGVFPSHLACELDRQINNPYYNRSLPNFGNTRVGTPVSKPAFAEDGTQRGFQHLRWYWIGE